jgi:hypothetical protein
VAINPPVGYEREQGFTKNSVTGALAVDMPSATVSLNTSDIEIGAVELKDGATNNRAVIDGSGNVAVAGTVTVANPTTNPETGLAKDATLTGGVQKAQVRGGAKGATAAADVTSTPQTADAQTLDVQVWHAGAKKDPTQVRALTSADVVTAAQGTAAAAASPWGVRLSDGAAFYNTPAAGQLPAALGANGALKVEGVASGTAQPVSGTVTANAGTGPFPVSDNAGSLTVDAPVGTPVFTRLSDGAAALVGQKAMASSLPVVVASDQGNVPVSQATASSLNATVVQATAANLNATVTGPTLTKGTQAATG